MQVAVQVRSGCNDSIGVDGSAVKLCIFVDAGLFEQIVDMGLQFCDARAHLIKCTQSSSGKRAEKNRLAGVSV
jgi:hypothetical protein